ncbi:MAG: immune inhibitor A [Actinomycetota bacterium]|nr:immune inhibitor A [Actinomycetota bacterium]
MRFLVAVVLLAFAAALLPLTGATAPKAKPRAGVRVKDVGPDYNEGKALPLERRGKNGPTASPGPRASGSRVTAQATPPPGAVESWVALDDLAEVAYLKDFTLRAVGRHVEVWVASELNVRTDDSLPPADRLDFPAGDCRNGQRTTITDAQVAYFVDQFDNDMYPLESQTFSVPPDRDGTGEGLFGPELTRPGDGDNIVVLIDNVRDDNFYDTDNAHTLPYIGGFFWSFINDVHDRNVMTIDAYDWIHRTRANPPHEPSSDPCASAPARPFLYEATFAHEYQHLLESYEDPDETAWVNEGLSDWAQTLTGYVNPATPVTQLGFDSHIQCFLGWLGVATPFNPIPAEGGPENSLTVWGDQVPDHPSEILCDYGAAYSFMEFLHGRYGDDFMTALHRGDANGFAGLQEALDAFGIRTTAQQVVHQWAAAVAVDGVIDRGAKAKGRGERAYQIPTMHATINWDTPETYDTPGAPPNGSDYVRLRDAAGNYLNARDIRSVRFNGVSTLPALPVEWTVDPNPPGQPGDAALYSGTGNNFDRAIIRRVQVPTGSPTLTFNTKWSTEPGFDSGYVQVSVDGGETWTSLANADTTCDLDPGANRKLVENCPGFNGEGGWKAESFSLAPYAGQTVLLSFRYISDQNTNGDGWWIDDVAVNGTVLSDGSSLAGWQSLTQVNPIEVTGYTVQILGYTTSGKRVSVVTLPLDRNFDGSFSVRGRHGRLGKLVEHKADVVAAIVTYDDPTESIEQYAPYTLKVNGVAQPGGR